ncbi:MAG: hypothetical protein HOP37_01945, partial [Cyclobacteriaceae bacterium]|nr:hypothetical protein [Cyclobacteriaceae bacterium]
MKTMKNLVGLKSISTLLIAFVLVLGSCNKTDDSILSATDSQNLSSEEVSESFTDEANDVSNVADNVITEV